MDKLYELVKLVSYGLGAIAATALIMLAMLPILGPVFP